MASVNPYLSTFIINFLFIFISDDDSIEIVNNFLCTLKPCILYTLGRSQLKKKRELLF